MRWGIVKPCGIFGESANESILINNICYLIRLFPILVLPGDGNYYFQPVHVRDIVEQMLFMANDNSPINYEQDSVGSDIITFKSLL